MKMCVHRLGQALVLIISLMFLGCEEDVVKVFPSDGATDVAVNSVVRIQFHTKKEIRDSNLQRSNFSLGTCAQTNSNEDTQTLAEETKNPASENSQPSQDPAANPAGASTDPTSKNPIAQAVNFLFQTQKYGVNKVHKDNQKPTEEMVRTEVLLIPTSSTREQTPLERDQRYCVSIGDVYDVDGELIVGTTTSFQTQDNPTFVFVENASVSLLRGNEDKGESGVDLTHLSPHDILLLRFSGPVHPNDPGIRVCYLDTKTPDEEGQATSKSWTASTTDPCRTYDGTEISTSMALVEIIDRKENKKTPMASFTTYALKGNPFRASSDFVLLTGLSKQTSNDWSYNPDNGHAAQVIDFSTGPADQAQSNPTRDLPETKDRPNAVFVPLAGKV